MSLSSGRKGRSTYYSLMLDLIRRQPCHARGSLRSRRVSFFVWVCLNGRLGLTADLILYYYHYFCCLWQVCVLRGLGHSIRHVNPCLWPTAAIFRKSGEVCVCCLFHFVTHTLTHALQCKMSVSLFNSPLISPHSYHSWMTLTLMHFLISSKCNTSNELVKHSCKQKGC